MAAIITSQFRSNIADQLLVDLRDDISNYYLFIGRSDDWPVDTEGKMVPDLLNTSTDNQHYTHTKPWSDMMQLKKMTAADVEYVVPRIDWLNGAIYDAYDDADANLENADEVGSSILSKYYAMTPDFKVFLCLRSGPAGSTVNPSSLSDSNGVRNSTSDGYVWKYLYTMQTVLQAKFLTTAYMPVTVPDIDLSGDDQYATSLQAMERAGAIYNVVLTDASLDDSYTAGEEWYVDDNSGRERSYGDVNTCYGKVLTIDSKGQVQSLSIENAGVGYSNGTVKFTTVSPKPDNILRASQFRCVISPDNGYGYSAIRDLRAHYIGVNMKLVYSEGSSVGTGDQAIKDTIKGRFFSVGTSAGGSMGYRRIGIIRNPSLMSEDLASGAIYDALSLISIPPQSNDRSAFQPGKILKIMDSKDGEKTRIKCDDYWHSSVDAERSLLRYHQDDETGYGTLAHGDTFKSLDSDEVTGVLYIPDEEANVTADKRIAPYTGEIVFLENRGVTYRQSDQIETIKLVIEL